MSEDERDISARRSDEGDAPRATTNGGGRRFPSLRRIGLHFLLLLLAFLAGFVPMWLRAREASGRLSSTQHELRLSQMENALAAASVDARRGEYEAARQSTSQFYTILQSAAENREETSGVSVQQRQAFERLQGQRDELITLLARNEPAAADRLLALYVGFRNTLRPPTPAASPAPR